MRGDFASDAARFSALDDAALETALLALRTCPRCRADLQPVALFDDVWGCKGPSHTFETWYLPHDEAK